MKTNLYYLQGITLTGVPAIIALIAIIVIVMISSSLIFTNPLKDEKIISEIKADVNRYIVSNLEC